MQDVQELLARSDNPNLDRQLFTIIELLNNDESLDLHRELVISMLVQLTRENSRLKAEVIALKNALGEGNGE